MASDIRTYIIECCRQGPLSWRKGAVIMMVLISLVLIGGLYLGWHFQAYPIAYFSIGTGAIAAFDVLAIFPYQLWKRDQKLISDLSAELDNREKREQHKQKKQQLLDEISAYREKTGRYRIEMEHDVHARIFNESDWQKNRTILN